MFFNFIYFFFFSFFLFSKIYSCSLFPFLSFFFFFAHLEFFFVHFLLNIPTFKSFVFSLILRKSDSVAFEKSIAIIRVEILYFFSKSSPNCLSLLSVLLIKTTLYPRFANSSTYAFPIPSVQPVTTWKY